MSESYTDFAGVYDTLMDETPYEEWKEFLIGLIVRYGVSMPKGEKLPGEDEVLAGERNLMVDLGCGTGKLTEMLAEAGYDMIGVDNSPEMLRLAMERRDLAGHETLYLCQDMRELELYSTIGTVISVCDSVNYLLSEEDLLTTFRLVENYLYPGGIFVFDFNTVYKYAEVIGDTTIAENREDCSFIWDNYYHEDEQINEYDLTLFVRTEDTLFQKYEETHYQRGYEVEQMRRLVEEAGLQFVAAIDADTHAEVTDYSERVYIVARECRKRNGV